MDAIWKGQRVRMFDPGEAGLDARTEEIVNLQALAARADLAHRDAERLNATLMRMVETKLAAAWDAFEGDQTDKAGAMVVIEELERIVCLADACVGHTRTLREAFGDAARRLRELVEAHEAALGL